MTRTALLPAFVLDDFGAAGQSGYGDGWRGSGHGGERHAGRAALGVPHSKERSLVS